MWFYELSLDVVLAALFTFAFIIRSKRREPVVVEVPVVRPVILKIGEQHAIECDGYSATTVVKSVEITHAGADVYRFLEHSRVMIKPVSVGIVVELVCVGEITTLDGEKQRNERQRRGYGFNV